MKVLILILLMTSSFAKTDYFLQGSLRSYPLGTAVNAELGEGYKFYDQDKVFYGYVRAAVNLQSSVLVNYAQAQVEFFPVSFLGFYYGKSYGKRSSKKLQGFDCDEIECETDMSKNYFGVNLALAFKGIKFVNFYKRSSLDSKQENKYFAEEFSNLVGINKDILITHTSLLGYDLNENQMLGVLYLRNQMHNLNEKSVMTMLLWQQKYDDKSIQVGIGKFQNRESLSHFGTLILFKWDLEKGVRLF